MIDRIPSIEEPQGKLLLMFLIIDIKSNCVIHISEAAYVKLFYFKVALSRFFFIENSQFVKLRKDITGIG